MLPTVTDAHVVLGRITALLGGAMRLDRDRAAAAVDTIAAKLGSTRRAAALGILQVANANMERAIRSVSVERGYDPREFALVAFGGCGGLHACEIAEDLGIRTVIVPEYAGALSAVGMLMADRVRDYSAGIVGRDVSEAQFRELERRARQDMRRASTVRSADVRYRGQSYEINIPWGSDFHAAHAKQYGYSDPARATEIVTIRVRAMETVPRLRFRASVRRKIKEPVRGPALVADYGSTTWIPPGWSYVVDKTGNLIATR
jgi:N-methylhydantoinase A